MRWPRALRSRCAAWAFSVVSACGCAPDAQQPPATPEAPAPGAAGPKEHGHPASHGSTGHEHGEHGAHEHGAHEHGAHEHGAAGHPHGAHAHHGPVDHRFDDPERWSKVFDDPKRDEWQKPDEVIRQLALHADDTVADLGAGTGYFSVRLARAVPKGKVLAIDIEPKLLEHLAERAKGAGLTNVQTILAAPDDPKLPAGTDVVLIVDTYHHLGDRVTYFRNVAGALPDDSEVVVVDFRMGKLPVGPPDPHKIAPDVIEEEMKRAGFTLCRSWDGLPYQHVLVFAERCPEPSGAEP